MRRIIVAAVIVGLAFTGTAWAEVTPNIDKGTKQLAIYGSYDNNHPLDYQLILGGAFGYFVTDGLLLSGVLGWQSNDLADSIEAGVVGEYNFNTNSPWVPFVKAGVLYKGVELDDEIYNVSDEADADAWLGRLGGGVKYFFRSDIAISLALNYDIASEDLYFDDDGNAENYNIKAVLGLNFYFD
jgi:hypothetical protein